jgi:hypothetical protein
MRQWSIRSLFTGGADFPSDIRDEVVGGKSVTNNSHRDVINYWL